MRLRRRSKSSSSATSMRLRAHVWGNDADGWDWEIQQKMPDGTWTVIGGRAADNECGDGFTEKRRDEAEATASAKDEIDRLIHDWRTRKAGLARNANAITYEAEA